MFERGSGILCHISSLTGENGMGSLGYDAYQFIDFLHESGQKYWQILPTNPPGFGYSPYQTYSAFANYPVFISLQKLADINLIPKDKAIFNNKKRKTVDYKKIEQQKYPLLKLAAEKFYNENYLEDEFRNFKIENDYWIHDYVLFASLKEYFRELPWYQWKGRYKYKDNETIKKIKATPQVQALINEHYFYQFIFDKQWKELKEYANSKNIKIIGDIPLYISYDSADVWSKPELFSLNKNYVPQKVAGVPPDYFSETGQLWGNPIYNWHKMKSNNFEWWTERFRKNLELFDIVRIDHFRGLSAYWSIPYGETTAINGKWVKAPGRQLLRMLHHEFEKLPLIAEDLGVITDDVNKLKNDFDLPGMKILQFAFDSGEENNYLPHTYNKNCVVYTGTHDNDTTLSWWKHLNNKDRLFLRKYLGSGGIQNITDKLINLAWASVADIAIVPVQDLLNQLGSSRMNTPGTSNGNWKYKIDYFEKLDARKKHLLEITKLYGRL